MKRLAVIVLVVVLAACSGDDQATNQDSSSTTTANATNPSDKVAGLPTCAEVFHEGATTQQDTFDIVCTTAADPQGTTLSFAYSDCTDGGRLYWSDVGWGYSGQPWHADATRPPAAESDACTG